MRQILSSFILVLLSAMAWQPKVQAQDLTSFPAYFVIKDSISKKELRIKNNRRFSLEVKNGYGYIRGPFLLKNDSLMSGDSIWYSLDTLRYFRVQYEKKSFVAFMSVASLPATLPLAALTGEFLYYVGVPEGFAYLIILVPLVYAGYSLLEAYGHFYKVSPHMQIYPALAPAKSRGWLFD